MRLSELAFRIGSICDQIGSAGIGIVKAFMNQRFPRQKAQLAEEVILGDEDVLNFWARHDGLGNLNGNGEERSFEQLLSVNIWSLKLEEHNRLLKYWHEPAVQRLSFELQNLMEQHASEKREYTNLFTRTDAQIFDQVDVVGVNTTGLANNVDLMRKLHTKVLICEEAAKVLESHILATLLPSVQHAILIGGHLQLRPEISNKRLSAKYSRIGPKYNLDESLFERLANFRSPNAETSTGDEEDAINPIRFPVA